MNQTNQRTSPAGPLPFQELVEAQGHLIDSQILEVVFDEVVQYGGRFEVEEFRIGRTNEDPSYLRLRVETPSALAMERLLQNLNTVGCYPVSTEDASTRGVEKDCCAIRNRFSRIALTEFCCVLLAILAPRVEGILGAHQTGRPTVCIEPSAVAVPSPVPMAFLRAAASQKGLRWSGRSGTFPTWEGPPYCTTSSKTTSRIWE
ncbi:MAG: hypothetical protein U5J83_01420 [Bryobacterales bacterium]|nr:hypothetical protein [Bryobacterales bacterium]